MLTNKSVNDKEPLTALRPLFHKKIEWSRDPIFCQRSRYLCFTHFIAAGNLATLMDFVDLEEPTYVKEEDEEDDDQRNSSKPVRRRARLALSCQRYVSRLSLLFVTHSCRL